MDSCTPEYVQHLGPACLLPSGLYRVFLDDGTSLTTHGPDPLLPTADLGFALNAEQRKPVCAAAPHMHVLYGRPNGSPDLSAQYLKPLREAVRRMNAVLNADAKATGNVEADYRVLCDASGEIRIDAFTGPDTGSGSAVGNQDYNAIVNAAKAAGFNKPKTDYLIFYDDASSPGICGVGSMTMDDSLSASNANLAGPDYGIAFKGCWYNRTPMHENGHNQGAVQTLATMSDLNGHCLEGEDVMCYTSDYIILCGDRIHYDCRGDTYFNAKPPTGNWLATHWNIGSRLNTYLHFGDQPPLPSVSPSVSASATSTKLSGGASTATMTLTPYTTHSPSSRATTVAHDSDSPTPLEDGERRLEPESVPHLGVLFALSALGALVLARRRR
jgi:hypothetical protein